MAATQPLLMPTPLRPQAQHAVYRLSGTAATLQRFPQSGGR